jgi:S-(hydroxymethyl)glutathione dehydrogenase/alcohol dehydrogenase
MKAALFVGVNEPISVEDVEPLPLGPRDVLVRITASGVCHSDLSLVDGTLPFPPPAVLGHEGAGVVEEVGEDVTLVKVGQRVISSFIVSCGECWYCGNGMAFVCAETMQFHAKPHALRGDGTHLPCLGGLGTMAETMTVDERLVVPVESDLPDTQLALIGCAITTGVGAVLNTAKVQPGSSVVVFGAGGVGQSVIQGARIAGAERIIAVDPVDLKRKAALQQGATDVLDPGDAEVSEAVRELTDGRGADYGFEVVGAPATVTATVDSVRSAGTAVVVGVMKPSENISLHGLSFIYSGKRVVSSFGGSSIPSRDFPNYVSLVESGQLDLQNMVSREYKLDDVNDAFRATAAGEVLRGVLT